MEYRKDIQGLRAIAVLFVFIFHLNSDWLPGGFIGVDIFFVISGYLISSIILNKLEKKSFSFFNFYKSRIKRIVPAYYFLLLVIAIVGIFIFVPSEVFTLRMSLFWSLLFNSNNYFATLDTYFGAANMENPLLHTWTLAVEMQFYLFLPLILFFIKRKWLLPVISFFTIALFTYSSYEIFINNNQQVMYYSLLARTPEFFIGVLISLTSSLIRKLPEKYYSSLNLLGLFLLIGSAFLLSGESNFPGISAIPPCLGAALLIAFPSNYSKKILSHRFMVYIGELSYSLYLWHWPIMAFIRYYYNTIELSWIQYCIVIILTILFSLFSYYIIETFLRKNKDWKVISAIGCIGLVCSFLVIKMDQLNNKVSFIPLDYITWNFAKESHAHYFTKVGVYGDTLSNDSILLIGDSHAQNFSYYLDCLGKKHSFSFRKISNNSYPLIPNIKEKLGNGSSSAYKNYQKLMMHTNEEIKNNKIIILQIYAKVGDKWEDEICNLIDSLRKDQYFILVSDFPSLDKNPVRINRDYIKNTNRDTQYKTTFSKPTDKILKHIDLSPRAFYMDLSQTPFFDEAPFYKDTLIYYDSDHLNMFGEKKYADYTGDKFMELLDSLCMQHMD